MSTSDPCQKGLMQYHPLLVSSLIQHAVREHPNREIVSYLPNEQVHRYTYAEAGAGARQLANALVNFGVKPGDRIATLAWNSFRHFELYFGISGMGAICHTINPRLFPDQIVQIIEDASDKLVFVDETLLDLVPKIASALDNIDTVIILGDAVERLKDLNTIKTMSFDDFVVTAGSDFKWPVLDELTACSLCYTSGTTGSSKGVLYSNRAIVLHTIAIIAKDVFSIGTADTVLAAVPMFHVNAWGLPYAAAATGCRLVLPGVNLDGKSLEKIFRDEGVTVAAAVPTVWDGLASRLEETGVRLPKLERLICGGAPITPALIERLTNLDIRVMHAWGMTELSPVAGVNSPITLEEDWRASAPVLQTRQGRPPFGIEIDIANDDGESIPRDGNSSGLVRARGHWVIDHYYGRGNDEMVIDEDHWFTTGDIGTIDKEGRLKIVDRIKDLVKSGGEWISSLELEDIANAHPDVAEAAVIAAQHDKWGERPLLICKLKSGASLTSKDILNHFIGKAEKWVIPDAVVFVEELPHTATGKLSKKSLRDTYGGFFADTTG